MTGSSITSLFETANRIENDLPNVSSLNWIFAMLTVACTVIILASFATAGKLILAPGREVAADACEGFGRCFVEQSLGSIREQ